MARFASRLLRFTRQLRDRCAREGACLSVQLLHQTTRPLPPAGRRAAQDTRRRIHEKVRMSSVYYFGLTLISLISNQTNGQIFLIRIEHYYVRILCVSIVTKICEEVEMQLVFQFFWVGRGCVERARAVFWHDWQFGNPQDVRFGQRASGWAYMVYLFSSHNGAII